MPNFTTYKNLEKPLSIERYNVNVANKNNDVIDSELHDLNLEDERIAGNLDTEIKRASDSENAIREDLREHTLDYSNPHKVTKAQVGLANVNNTSDIDKPVSTAQQNAIESAISNHNDSDSSHSEIRNLISDLTTRLNSLADCDDTTLDQLSEIVAYIKNNKSLIDSVTTSKVNVSDIIDNLTSTATNKPLSAKQGKVLKDLINALTTTVNGKADKDIVGVEKNINQGTNITYSCPNIVYDQSYGVTGTESLKKAIEESTDKITDEILKVHRNSITSIWKNGNEVATHDTNSHSKYVNITVPTKISDLINDSEFLEMSGGEISNDDKSMLITPSGIKGDDGQSLTDFYKVEADSVHGRVLYYDDEDTDERYFPASGGFIDGSITVEDDVVVGGVLEAKEILDESGTIPISIKKKHDVDETELLIYGTGIYIKGHGDDGYNVNIDLIKSLQEIEDVQNKLNNHSDDYTISQLGSEYPTIWVNGEEKNNANYTFHYYGTSIDGNFLHCPANATGVWITNNTGRTVTFYVKCKAASNAYIQYGYGKPEGSLPNYQNTGANREYFVAARGTGKIESYLCAVPSGKNFFFGCANGDISWIGTDYLVNITASKAVKAEQDSEGNKISETYLKSNNGRVTDIEKILGNLGKEIDLTDATLDLGIRDDNGNWLARVEISRDKFNQTIYENEAGINIVANEIKITNSDGSGSVELSGSGDFKLQNPHNEIKSSNNALKINSAGDIDTLVGGHANIIADTYKLCTGTKLNSKEFFRISSSGKTTITPQNDCDFMTENVLRIGSKKRIDLVVGDEIGGQPSANGVVRTTNLQGRQLDNGKKASLTNYQDVGCETINNKIPFYSDIAVLADYTSVGRNLENISWAQIKADVDNGDVNKYCVGDYKDITITSGYKFRMRIAGINIYSGKRCNVNSGYLGCHIDWISDEVGFNTRYREIASNNGTSTSYSPFVGVEIHTYMNNTVINYIPQEIRDVISDKYLNIEGRYSASGNLSSSNYYLYNINNGKLWLPTEVEVIGYECFGTRRVSSGQGQQTQYPIFRDFPRFTQKRDVSIASTNPNMQPWWLATAYDGNASNYIGMGWQGYIFNGTATDYNKIPLCFRIASDNYN